MKWVRGDRVYVRPAPPEVKPRGNPRKYVNEPATFLKSNGTWVLLEIDDGRVVWVNKLYLERLDG